jgi:phage-related protein
MKTKFEVIFLEEARQFLLAIENKARAKMIYNIEKAKYEINVAILKKITADIWEFRTSYNNTQYRLFAFWDTRDNKNILVIATHGILKKSTKTPFTEIQKTKRIRRLYFQ